jgi:hypothetical protein
VKAGAKAQAKAEAKVKIPPNAKHLRREGNGQSAFCSWQLAAVAESSQNPSTYQPINPSTYKLYKPTSFHRPFYNFARIESFTLLTNLKSTHR